MTAPSSALPSELIERLFLRFQAIYGNRVAQMWGDTDPQEVRQTWERELNTFQPSDIKSALETMRTAYPDYPPTLFQFVGMARDHRIKRVQTAEKLPPPKADPEQAREILRRVREMLTSKKVC